LYAFLIYQARHFYAAALRQIGNQPFVLHISVDYRRLAGLHRMHNDRTEFAAVIDREYVIALQLLLQLVILFFIARGPIGNVSFDI